MKRLIQILTLAIIPGIISSCGDGEANTLAEAKQTQSVINQNMPGMISTSNDGYYIKAKIDGKDWSASHMLSADAIGKDWMKIRGEKGETRMDFQLQRKVVEVGKKKPFNETNGASVYEPETSTLFLSRSGEVEITKVDNQWIEGIFHFPATDNKSGKQIQVTEGFFRVASGVK